MKGNKLISEITLPKNGRSPEVGSGLQSTVAGI
jgi:hypothetical protein